VFDGGVREIFVLQFIDRLIVNFAEYMARCICELFPGEMQTHPEQKLHRISEFYKDSERVKNKKNQTKLGYVRCFNSDDNTTWCQRFVMSLFGCVFSQFVPDPFLVPLLHIFNMCTKKRLQLPYQLLRQYRDRPDESSLTDSSMNIMKDQFLNGPNDHQHLINQGGTLLSNTSNFMQGIFHYVSSLFHAGYMTWMKGFLTEFVVMHGLTLHNSYMVSSDDSWMGNSVFI
jgi:hypothetical protein